MDKRRLVSIPGGAPGAEAAPGLTEGELLAGVRSGDPSMAGEFYRRVKPIVGRTVRRLLGRLDQDGEDIAQLAMVQIIEALPRYRGECALDAWVSSVAAHVIYKHIRRRRLERALFVRSGGDEDWEAPGGPSLSGVLQARQVVTRLGKLFAQVNPERAWSFLLHDVCGYSLDEVAHICSVSVAAAQSRLSRGRREIHARIAADAELAQFFDGAFEP